MSDLSTLHLQRMDRINTVFFDNGDGLTAVAERSRTVDEIVCGKFEQYFGASGHGMAVLAVGGYGRSQLFPFSDVDLLFLFPKDSHAQQAKETLSRLLTSLWDAQLRISQSVRTPSECSRLAAGNSELHVSLLDARFLAGDRALYDDLVQNILPRLFLKERHTLMGSLIDMARDRHAQFDGTIYHLEPDIKEGPGGLRDFQLSCWLSQLAHVEPDRTPDSEAFLPREFREPIAEAKKFLFPLRCYLHYFTGRDNNRLGFDLQEAIAADGSGKAFPEARDAAEWMQDYYRHIRIVHRLAMRLIDEHANSKESLFNRLRDRSTRLSSRDFSVARGRVFLRYTNAIEAQPEVAFELFRTVGRYGLPLAMTTDRIVEKSVPRIREYVEQQASVWKPIAEIFDQPHCHRALTSMRETGVLYAVFPELEAIDCLVLRDFYHRYTVDEHSVLAIRALKRLDPAADHVAQRYVDVAAEVDRLELVYFALLYHDVGRGHAELRAESGDSYVEASVAAIEKACDRLGLPQSDRETLTFLVRHQTSMADFVTKRDISDPETIEEFADLVGSIERLRMLLLLTYGDTTAVNPTAMTAWRKELLWRLFLFTFNRLTAEAEDRRIHVEPTAPALAAADDEQERESLRTFLEGFPERYLRTHSPDRIRAHHELSLQLREKKVAVRVERSDGRYNVVVCTWDRPFLFASLCATMAGFGLNIERAEAFSNAEGMVLDMFSVSVSESRGGTELEETDLRQLAKTLRRVIEGREDAAALIKNRKRLFGVRGRVPVKTEISYDNETSSRATIFHVIAEDRTGLLYDLTSTFSQHGCDIEVVMIETQGRKAIDVFYVISDAAKLSDEQCRLLTRELGSACRAKAAA